MIDINANWKDVVADSFCGSVRDGTHDSPKFVENGHFLITSKNIRNGRVILETANLISEQDFVDINRRSKVDQWDVLFSMIGTVGEVCLVCEEEPPFAIKNIGLFKVGDEIKAKWLYYWLCSPMTQAAIRQACRGASQQYIPLGELRKFPVRVPTKPRVMHKIVDVVSTYDDLIENNRCRIALLEEAAQLLYREWFVHFRFPGHEHIKIKNGVPDGWKSTTIGARFVTVLGGTPSRKNAEFWNGDVAWINSGEVNRLRILVASEFITEEGLAKSAAKLMPPGTTVLAITGATLGQVSRIEIETSANQSVVGIFDTEGVQDELIYLFFVHEIRKIINRATGGAQQHINKGIVNAVEYLEPPKSLVRLFRMHVKTIFDQMKALELQNIYLHQARDLLLPRLMSGKIAV